MKIDKGVPMPIRPVEKKTSKFTEIVARMEPGDSVGDFSTLIEANVLSGVIRRHRRKKAAV